MSLPLQTPITADQKYCSDCGTVILRRAEICPNCGCRQLPEPRSSQSVTFARAVTSVISTGTPSPDTGKMVVLFICNFLWSGLGNLVIGDKRGWQLGFLNWLVFALSWFTFGLPSLLFFGFCCFQGYKFLTQTQIDNAHISFVAPLGGSASRTEPIYPSASSSAVKANDIIPTQQYLTGPSVPAFDAQASKVDSDTHSHKSFQIVSAILAIALAVVATLFFTSRNKTEQQSQNISLTPATPLGSAPNAVSEKAVPLASKMNNFSPAQLQAPEGKLFLSSEGELPVAPAVRSAIDEWSLASEANDPVRLSEAYATHIDRFFLKKDIDRSFVATYMASWLSDGSRKVISFKPENIHMHMSEQELVTVDMIKHVVAEDAGARSERFTRSVLIFKNEEGAWKVYSERDFR